MASEYVYQYRRRKCSGLLFSLRNAGVSEVLWDTLPGSSQHPSGEKDPDLPVFLFKEAMIDLMTDSHDDEFFSRFSSDSPLITSGETEKFPVKSQYVGVFLMRVAIFICGEKTRTLTYSTFIIWDRWCKRFIVFPRNTIYLTLRKEFIKIITSKNYVAAITELVFCDATLTLKALQKAQKHRKSTEID